MWGLRQVGFGSQFRFLVLGFVLSPADYKYQIIKVDGSFLLLERPLEKIGIRSSFVAFGQKKKKHRRTIIILYTAVIGMIIS